MSSNVFSAFIEIIICFFVAVSSLLIMGYMNRIPNVKNQEKEQEGTLNNKIKSIVQWIVKAY